MQGSTERPSIAGWSASQACAPGSRRRRPMWRSALRPRSSRPRPLTGAPLRGCSNGGVRSSHGDPARAWRGMTYREFVRDLAAHDDSAFAEYVSGLRFPAHLREAYGFAAANPRAIMLMPRG